ncbi:cyclic nucleotide-binding-like protein [Catenaria anguillulae PL171]|uniref:Cyclic nucleotide-binding-like protein n=1 Tax=Catenaria anguillulae PL171 TaxID=765915 RepID=A0A1Y2HSE5_9FUNG|nr:cyclic nucleotide-binding-like protein [Catenaria anguillulae PL171]
MSHFNVPSTDIVSLLFHLTWAILIVDLLVCALTASTDRDDAIGLLPLNVLLANSHATSFASFHYFNRVLVLFRVWWWFERLNNRVMSMYVLWAVKAIATLILGTHYLACVWWVIGRIDSDWRNGIPSWSQQAAKSAQWKAVLSTDAQSPDAVWAPLWFRQYIVSLYWVVNMALIPEASHLSVQSFQERWMGKVVYIVAQMYIAWIGSSLTSVLANSRAIRTTMQKRADVIMDFLKTSKLPQHLRKRVKEYLNFSWLRNRGVDATTLLDDLPSTLRAELALKAYGHLLTKVPLFSGADDAFFRALSLALRPILFLEGEDIVRQGDLGAEMFALLRGSVHIIAVAADGSEKILSTLHQGAYFGEISLYLSRPRTVTVRAATRVDILVLTKQSLDAVLKLYPDVHSRIIAMAQERLRQDAQRAGALTDPAAKEPQTPQVELEPASVVRPSQGLSNRRQSLLVSVAPHNVPFPPGEPFVSRSRRMSRDRTVDRTVDMDGQSAVGSSSQHASRSPILKTPSGSPLPVGRPNADNLVNGAIMDKVTTGKVHSQRAIHMAACNSRIPPAK